MRRVNYIETFLQDVRFGLRMLRKTPGFTTVAMLTLALGIGANTAIFSMVNAVLLRQLPLRDPARLVWVWGTRVDRDKAFASIQDYVDYRDQNRTLKGLAAFGYWNPNLTGTGAAERLLGTRISANAFELLGVKTYLGRTLEAADDNPANGQVVVLTYGTWAGRFGADRSLVGRNLELDGESYTVVGVLPPDFFFPIREAQLAVPLRPTADPRRWDRGDRFLRMVGRLKAGVNRRDAEAELSAIVQRLSRQYPKTNVKNTGMRLVPLQTEITGNFRLPLLVLQGAVALVLLIACANLANLLLARGSGRRHEAALRTALGASRERLLRQLLTESLLLALGGAVAGIALAYWGIPALLSLSPAELPRAHEIGIQSHVLMFALGASVLSGILFGLVPAWKTTGVDLNEVLKTSVRGSVIGGERAHLRSTLIVSEVALSFVLLLAAGLLLKSFVKLQDVEPGFDADHVLAIRLSLPKTTYTNSEDVTVFYQGLALRLSKLPGVQSVGAVSGLPLSGSWATTDFSIVGRPPAKAQEEPSAQLRFATPGYFSAMRIPIQRGRRFTEADTARTRQVALISETFARRFFLGQDPVGQHLLLDTGPGVQPQPEIVGVLGDVKQLALESRATADIYVPVQQMPQGWVTYFSNNMDWTVRATGNPATLAALVRDQVAGRDSKVATTTIRPVKQFLSSSLAGRRFNLLLLAIFAVVALAMATLGVYGVLSNAVGERQHEMGVRMALGAQGQDVLGLVFRQGFRLTLIGITFGIIGALVLTRFLSSLLYGVAPTDWLTFVIVSLIITAAALFATYIPARRATKVDPMLALRYE